ncbi:small RNA 2'-O-methyltransferase-like [Telopea speciosissima]|uniref:small RNA 2'-O-methyltransferase-like n=1 Tax=Telopea speciosissima TaxID=54955 RepID=UPI001CC486CC|nr:small RNA 2'-O-methyltransferase-like [Telopea speciosissima]XP_043689682.1 small RNA 2'-O-methyltransferase-like [Telopea speciosissima]
MGETPTIQTKKSNQTPKAIIHQKYGSSACYRIEEVREPVQNSCPGLAIPQQGPCLFRCNLQLPGLSVTSEAFKKKKDAEQNAAQMAIEKLDIQPATDSSTSQEPWDVLIAARISSLFSNEFLSSQNQPQHPLIGHFRAALQRETEECGLLPVSILATYDAKLNNLCKSINHKLDRNPHLIVTLIMKAARKSGSAAISQGKLWISKQTPYTPEILQALTSQQLSSSEGIWIQAVRIPCSIEKPVEPVTLYISSDGYYMDAIAQELGLTDTSQILVSRTVGKASSEMRLYFSALESPVPSDLSLEDLLDAKEPVTNESFNDRASYFSSQNIYGDAILASIGYTWKFPDLFHEDVSLGTYYRMLIGRLPNGGYKLSREAILVAELPIAFTSRSNWRGSYPWDLLEMFCRQHWLSEPVYSIISITDLVDPSLETSQASKKLKVANPAEEETKYANGRSHAANDKESIAPGGSCRCEVKILSKGQDLIIECSPVDSYRKPNDAKQNAALKVLSWLNKYLRKLDMHVEKLSSSGATHGLCFYPENFSKEFALCLSVHAGQLASSLRKCSLLASSCMDQLNTTQEHGVCSFKTEGLDSGVFPSNGSLICISYVVSLVRKGEHMKESLESSDEFEFEVGTGAVIPQVEACVTQMSMNQSAHFNTELPPREFIFAAAGDSLKSISLLSMGACFLEYSISLLRVTEPLEDRMEQALFSPPLSKQRVEYALRHINESCATTLVDFGCGSGSLLDSLLDMSTSLEKIVGVDISRKSLSRAAKALHLKLSENSDPAKPSRGIKSALLYDGSITVFDSRLGGFDIGTCLEVIEHMEEDQACLFGDVVLSSFRPSILIVSTPNYEYNSILQRTDLSKKDEDPDEKMQSLPCKFRNHDHKFEWTREQFNNWASDLAMRHNYSVEFSGVGGSADVEPGFASQIAIFRRGPIDAECSENLDIAQPYEVIWNWSRS